MGLLRWVSLFVACALLVACGSGRDRPPPGPFTGPINCRTVNLFDKQMEPPSASVPEKWRVFAGHWGKGAWDGKLCHEIVVEAVYPDGTARVVDMQGYYTPWGLTPTAFRRKGYLTEDGALVVNIGRSGTLTYRYQAGVVYGVWQDDSVNRDVGVTLRPI